jgi:hypothetical protein
MGVVKRMDCNPKEGTMDTRAPAAPVAVLVCLVCEGHGCEFCPAVPVKA